MELSTLVIIICMAVAIGLCIFFYIRKDLRVKILFKKYPEEVAALINKPISSVDKITDEDKEVICAFPSEKWSEWVQLKQQFTDIFKKYPYATHFYFLQNFSNNAGRLKHPKTIVSPSTGYFVKKLSYDQLEIMSKETTKFWAALNTEILSINGLIATYPAGYAAYCEANPTVSRKVLIDDKTTIEEFQNIGAQLEQYKDFEARQVEFSKRYVQETTTLKSTIIVTHMLTYQKRTINGTEIAEIPFNRIVLNEYSNYQLDEQPPAMKELNAHLEEFKARTRYYKTFVYDRIVEAIKNVSLSRKVLVVLVNQSGLNWPQSTYMYHYKYLEETLTKEEIAYCYLSELRDAESKERYQCDIAFVMDFVSTLNYPVQNIDVVYQALKTYLPVVGYYSLISECTNLKAGAIIAKYQKDNFSDLPF